MIILQVGDLQYASPATVSRCGMVFVDPKNLKYKPYWQKWTQGRENEVGISAFGHRVFFIKYRTVERCGKKNKTQNIFVKSVSSSELAYSSLVIKIWSKTA